MEIDFQSVQDVIELAGDTGSAAQKVGGALESIKALFGTTKSGADPEVKLAMAEMLLQVANTQATNAQLIQKLTALEIALKSAQAMQTDFDRYELWKTPAGSFVHRLKEGNEAGEPDHFLCPNCMEDKRKSILQGDRVVKCPKCSVTYFIEPTPPRKSSRPPRRGPSVEW